MTAVRFTSWDFGTLPTALPTLRFPMPGCSSSIQAASVPRLGYPNALKGTAAQRSGFRGILCWVAQVPGGRSDALPQLQVEPTRSNAVFVRVHELPPGSPRFCPHPRRGASYSEYLQPLTLNGAKNASYSVTWQGMRPE